MADFKLKPNQAALILESSEDGEIIVDVAISNDGAGDSILAAALCKVIAQKLTSDEQFQAEIMAELDGG
ncbi:twitching motility protein [Thermodesulfobacteriota bacterium]